MNPFDLRGPEFLVFYTLLGAIVLFLVYRLVHADRSGGQPPDWPLEDPYEIAYLRGGETEAQRVATVALVDRGLLKASGDKVFAVPRAASHAKRPIESEIVAFFEQPHDAVELFQALAKSPASEQYRRRLVERGLLPGDQEQGRRSALAMGAILVLLGVSAIKIAVALARGRHNIVFLIVLTITFAFVAALIAGAKRTVAGDSLVKKLRERFASLRARAAQVRPGGATNELSYLAAAFGLAVLPKSHFPYVKQLFPKAAASGGSAFGGGCGSSGCGGGGGGGGCGGGCGGCGG